MAASYPSGTKSFSTKVDGPGQTVFAAHVNDIQDEVVAVENGLRTGVAHNLSPDGDVTRALGITGTRWLLPSGTVTAPGVPVGETGTGMYSSASGALELGTGGVKALGIDSTRFIDSPTQPRCVAYNNATQSIANNDTTVVVTFNSEDIDVGTMHDTVTNTSRITIPAGGDGLYWVRGFVRFPANATGQRVLTLRKNGATELREVEGTASTQWNSEVEISGLFVLAAADYVEMMAYQNSGGAMSIGAATRKQSNELAVVKLW